MTRPESNKRLVTSLNHVVLANVLVGIVNFVAMAWFARSLGPGTMGDYALIITALQLISALFSAGFDQALIRHPDDKAMADAAYAASAVQSVLLVLSSSLVYALYFYQTQDSHNVLFPGAMVLGSLILSLYFNLYSAPIAAAMDYKLLSRARLLSTVFGVILGVVSALNDLGLYALVIRDISSAIVMYGIIRMASPMRAKLYFERSSFAKLFAFSRSMWALNLMERVILRLDYALVGIMFGKEMLGVYFVIRGMLEGVLGFLLQPIQTVLYAHYCNTVNSNKRHALDKFGLTYWTLIVIASIASWFIAPAVISYLLGNEYKIGATVIPGLVIYAGAVLWFENIKVLSMAMDLHHGMLYSRAIQASILLGMFYPLISNAGILGAGLVTAIAAVALAVSATLLMNAKNKRVAHD